MTIENLTTGRSAAGSVFGNYDFLYGTVMVSEYTAVPKREKIQMVFESTLDAGFIHAESVYIDDERVLAGVENAAEDIKRVERVIYPASEVFEASFFGVLQRVIRDVQEKTGD